jgi:hypothetical protein
MLLGHHVRPIIKAIKSADHKTLASVHLHDNQFDSETKNFILSHLGINADDHKEQIENILHEKIDPDITTTILPNKEMKKHQHKFFTFEHQ